MKFTHLNVKSDYSILEGIGKAEGYLDKCLELKMNALGIANYGTMFGTLKFYLAAKKRAIKPIIGVEIKSDLGSFLIYAKNFEGYKNLIRLVSLKEIKKDDLLKLENVILISCFNKSFFNIFPSDYSKEIAKILKEKFNEDFYFEICNNKSEDEMNIQKVKHFAFFYNIQLVATANSHYIEKEDSEIKYLISSIKGKSYSKEDLHFKTTLEMYQLFKDYKRALENSNIVAEKCNVEIAKEDFIFPKLKNSEEILKKIIKEEAFKKYTLNRDVIQRVTKELNIIIDKKFQDYFLVVKDIIDYAKSKNILIGPGRGSAASSIISYILGITEVDPLKYNLLFERFLNLKRVKKPDIDIDICHERRDELIEYAKNKYNAYQIITFGKMTPKLLLIEFSRVYKVNLHEYIDENLKIIKNSPIVEKVLKYIKKLEGNIWNQSIHASGVVLCDNILNYSPLLDVITQYDMDELEYLGLLKIDLLGLKTLSLLHKTIKKIKDSKDKDIILKDIPLNDNSSYKLLKDGKTKYIFQLESNTAKKILQKVDLENIENLSMVLALNRPGPLQSDMLESFLNKNAKNFFIYQEQIMEFVSSFTGCSLEDSEILIRIISKKEKNLLLEYEKKFKEDALRNGKNEEEIKEAFNEISKFASYSFNKAHSISYSLLSYYCVYFKANYLEEFLASNIDLDSSQIQILKDYVIIKNPNINLSNFDSKVIDKKIILGLSSIRHFSEEILNQIIKEREKSLYKSLEDFIQRNKNISKNHLRILIFAGAFDTFDGSRFDKLEIIEKTNQLNLFANENRRFLTIAQEKQEEINSLGVYLSLYPKYDKNEKIGIVRELERNRAAISLENEIIGISFNIDLKVNDIVKIEKEGIKKLNISYIN